MRSRICGSSLRLIPSASSLARAAFRRRNDRINMVITLLRVPYVVGNGRKSQPQIISLSLPRVGARGQQGTLRAHSLFFHVLSSWRPCPLVDLLGLFSCLSLVGWFVRSLFCSVRCVRAAFADSLLTGQALFAEQPKLAKRSAWLCQGSPGRVPETESLCTC